MKNSTQYPPVTVLLMAAGSGKRLNAGVNKIWLELAGVTILERNLRFFHESALVDSIVIVAAEDEKASLRKFAAAKKLAQQPLCHVVSGGAERQDSVRNGLEFLKAEFAKETDDRLVAVHDAARPLITLAVFTAVVAAASEYGAAGVGVPVKDTIKQVDLDGYIVETPDRSTLWAIQTPQVFNFNLLWECYEAIAGTGRYYSDDCGVVEYCGHRIKLVAGSYENIKITTPEDLELAELILKRRKEQC